MKKNFFKISSALVVVSLLSSCGSTNNPVSAVSSNISSKNEVKKDYKVLKTINVGKVPHGMWQVAGFVYNSNIGEGTVSVIDTKTDTVVKTITFENGTAGYAKSFNDDKNILITDTKKGELIVIDPTQDHKIIQTISVGLGIDKIKISEDDKTVYLSITGESKIISLTFESDRSKAPTKKEIKVGAMTKGSEHRSLSLNNEWILTPNTSDNDVSLVNLNTGVEKRLKDGNKPSVVSLGAVKGKVNSAIIGNSASNTITIFDVNSDNKKTISDVGLSPTEAVTVDDLNRTFITMSGSNEVAVIDYEKQTLVSKIKVGSRPVHIYSVSEDDGKFSVKSGDHDESKHQHTEPVLWVGNDAGDSVSIIDSESLEVKATVNVGKGHHKMAFTKEKAYISNITDNTITVIQK